MDVARFVALMIGLTAIALFATVSIVTTVAAHIVNWRAYRRRERDGESHEGAHHASGVPLAGTAVALVGTVLARSVALNVVFAAIAAVDLLLFASGAVSYVVRRSRTGSCPPPR